MNASIWGTTGADTEADSVRAGAHELGSLSQLPFPLELKVLSPCPSLSAPARGVAVGTFLGYLNPWQCNRSCRLKLGIRWCHSNVPIKSDQGSMEPNALTFCFLTLPTAC